MHKTTLLLLSTVLLTTTAWAGGSIFGGHKHKTANPYGVYSIGVHICSDLECPPIRIVQGNCTGENMSKHWGVCVCEAGYMPNGEQCDPCPLGQVSDGLKGCTPCPEGSYVAQAGDTECTPCPGEHAATCDDGGLTTSCTDGYVFDEWSNTCLQTCTSYTEQECAEGMYCNFDSATDCMDSTRGTGICTPLSPEEKATRYSANMMDWWSANSFCLAMGLTLYNDTNFAADHPKFVWMHDDAGDDCHANAAVDGVVKDFYFRDGDNFYALCR